MPAVQVAALWCLKSLDLLRLPVVPIGGPDKYRMYHHVARGRLYMTLGVSRQLLVDLPIR